MKKVIIALVAFAASQGAFAWYSSAYVCDASTVCPDGTPISCVTYGYNYSNVPSYMSSACRSRVIPGQAVQCQGYQLQVDAWGRAAWGTVNIPVTCPRRRSFRRW